MSHRRFMDGERVEHNKKPQGTPAKALRWRHNRRKSATLLKNLSAEWKGAKRSGGSST